MLFEVGLAQPAAVGAHERVDLVGDGAAVEDVPPLLRQPGVGAGQIRVFEHLTLGRRVPARRERLDERTRQVLPANDLHIAAPIIGDEFADREPLVGIPDGGREHLGHRQPPEFRVQLEPAVDRARHADRQQAQRWNRRAVQLRELRLQLLIAQPPRRPPGAIQAVEFPVLRAPHEGKQVAAHPAAHRFHQAERGVGRDRRVDGGAAGLERIEPDLRRERLAGADHTVRCDHLGACGEGPAGDAVHLGHRDGSRRDREDSEQHETAADGLHAGTISAPGPRSTHPLPAGGF